MRAIEERLVLVVLWLVAICALIAVRLRVPAALQLGIGRAGLRVGCSRPGSVLAAVAWFLPLMGAAAVTLAGVLIATSAAQGF